MKEYSVWVDETAKIVSFHEVDNSELIYFDQREIYLAYLSALTTQGYSKIASLENNASGKS